MAHAQKPDFVFRRNGRVHLNRRRTSVQSTTVSRGVRISISNAGYTMFRGSVKSIGIPLNSPVSPSQRIHHQGALYSAWLKITRTILSCLLTWTRSVLWQHILTRFVCVWVCVVNCTRAQRVRI